LWKKNERAAQEHDDERREMTETRNKKRKVNGTTRKETGQRSTNETEAERR
jgi:hypothetical protein